MQRFSTAVENRQPSIVNRQSKLPAVSIAFSFSLGIAASQICREYSFAGLIAGDLALILAAFLALRSKRLSLSLTAGLAAILIAGLLMALAERDGFSGSHIRSQIAKRLFPLGEPVSFEACVIKESEPRGEESVATVELLSFLRKGRWIVCKGKGILRIAESQEQPEPEGNVLLMRGDRVRGWAVWNLPRGFENPGSAEIADLFERRGIFVIGRTKSLRLLETIPGGCTDTWTEIANTVRARVRKSLEPIADRERGQPAAILASLTIGEYSGIDNRTREIFQNSGTFHVLVVSGLHVAWITGLFIQFGKLVCLPERLRYVLASLVILLYVCVVGSQASLTRCLWMFLLYLAGRMLFRRTDALNLLLGSALILLAAHPCWLFETGFQLSFLSVAAIAMTAAPVIDNWIRPVFEPVMHSGKPDRLFLQPGKWHRCGRKLRTALEILTEALTDPLPPVVFRILILIPRGIGFAGLSLAGMICASLAVQIWLAPLLACCFNRISWISPVANLAVVPFSSIVLVAGIAAAITANFPVIGPALIKIAGSMASLLLCCADRITAVEGAWQRCPTPSPACVIAGILLLSVWSYFRWRKFWVPCSAIALMLACLSYGSIPVLGSLLYKVHYVISDRKTRISDAPVMSFTFLDVGEGDCTIVRFPDGRVWVLDAGGLRQPASQVESAYGFDIGEAVVSRYLWHEWIREIDRLILSHADIDHAGGIPAVMRNFHVNRFDFSRAVGDPFMEGISKTATDTKIETCRIHSGVEENVGSVNVKVFNPPSNPSFITTNENSIVLAFSYRKFSALMTGDLERGAEIQALSNPGFPRCNLLKVAHHGSRFGTSNSFLDRTKPSWAIISVGRNNPFGHPSKEVLDRLRQHQAQPILTVDEGAVTLETDGSRYVIKSHLHGLLYQGTL